MRSGGNIIPALGTCRHSICGLLRRNTSLRAGQAFAQIACDLLPQEKRVAIGCVTDGTQKPANAYKYVTGKSLGAS